MPALTVAIDASTYAASVALLRGDTLLREQTVAMRDPRQERIMTAGAHGGGRRIDTRAARGAAERRRAASGTDSGHARSPAGAVNARARPDARGCRRARD